jgi:predicted TIM-barrel fold metal-dependent hydrolase
MMNAQRLISADSHVNEPSDLWQTRLDRKFRDRAPHITKNEKGPGFLFVVPGVMVTQIAGGFAAGKSGHELKEHMAKGYEAARPGGWDPAERIKDQDIDGVQAEVIYTTLGARLFGLQDAEFQCACFRAFNGWLAQYCSHDPRRLAGIGLIPLDDIGEAVKELEFCAKSGLRGVAIWAATPEDRPFGSKIYEPFWQAASAAGLPLSLHLATGATFFAKQRNTQTLGPEGYVNAMYEVPRSLCALVYAGVMERHPKLNFISVENDVGWLPHFLYRLDHAYEKYWAMMSDPMPHPPSEYLRRQLYATFQDDPVGPATYQLFGENNYMWASDYPHSDSTWPNSRDIIKRNFGSLPAAVTHKIVCENVARLYGLPLS